jgi:hypothetical protein
MILVVWAASFGLDERGLLDVDHGAADSPSPPEESDIHPTIAAKTVKKEETDRTSERKTKNFTMGRNKERKETTDAMLREILELIDFHGVMRRPTWDGVRALLLIMPLMEGNLSSTVRM